MSDNWGKTCILFVVLGMIFGNIASMASADVLNSKIHDVYVKPYHDKYQYSFKIFAGDTAIGPYKLHVESDVDYKIIDKGEIIKANTWVQWFTYIYADDPNTIKVNIFHSDKNVK